MNREHVLEWADGDRKDRGLIQPVGVEEEESVVVKIYVRGDRETDELISPFTAWGVVLTTDGSAETPMDDISGVSGQQRESSSCHIHDNEGNLAFGKRFFKVQK